MKPNKKKVGERIHEIRTNLGYSMEEFGKLIGDSPRSSVNNWEKGVSIPKADKLQKIALLGNTIPEKILYGEGSEYLFDLFNSNLGVRFSDEILHDIFEFVPPKHRSYTNDILWLEVAKFFIEKGTLGKTVGNLEYDPIVGAENLYTGQYKDEFIQQAENFQQFKIKYYIYADVKKNVLHVIPFSSLNNENENLYYKAPYFLEQTDNHGYYTNNFDQIDLQINHSKIVYYSIKKDEMEEAIIIFDYCEEENKYLVVPLNNFELYSSFEKQLKKMLRKFRNASN